MFEKNDDLMKAVKAGDVNAVAAALTGGWFSKAADVNFKDGVDQTPLHFACAQGHVEVVKLLLEHKANIEAANEDGWTLLHVACINGQVEVVKLLLAHKANIEAATKYGWTPLYNACVCDQVEVVKLLLAHKANIEAATNDGRTSLHSACYNGQVKVVKLLLESGANALAKIKKGYTCLDIANSQKHNAIVKLLEAHLKRYPSGAKPLPISKALIQAAYNRDVRGVTELLNRGADINTQDSNGWSPLFIACWQGDIEMIKLLLTHKANIEAATKNGAPPLYIACLFGQVEVVKLLLDHKANIEAAEKSGGTTPLHMACQEGKLDVVKLLLAHRANIEAGTKYYGATPLYIACCRGYVEVAKLLLESGANALGRTKAGETCLDIANSQKHNAIVKLLEAHLKRYPSGAKPLPISKALIQAAYNKDIRGVTELLNSGADINTQDSDGYTPLHIACKKGQIEVVKLLLDHRANIEAARKDGATPLYSACEKGKVEVAKLLLTHKANIEAGNKNGATPLYIACQNGQAEVVKLLLEHRANIEAARKDGDTPLYIACCNGQIEVVKLLLTHKANIEAGNKDGDTPLYIACQNGYVEVVKLLLNHRANIEAATKDGATSLHIACRNGHHVEVVKLLLDHRANIEAVTKDGYTPLHIACRNGQVEVVKLLLESGANALAKIKEGYTCLDIAKTKKHNAIVKLLETHLKQYPPDAKSLPIKDALPSQAKMTTPIPTLSPKPTTPKQQAEAIPVKAPATADANKLSSPEKKASPKPPKRHVIDEEGGIRIELAVKPNQFSPYDPKNKLGQGSFGIVYKGKFDHGNVAIKQFTFQAFTDKALKEFKHEVALMANLRHTHIVQLMGACFEPGHYALIMEYFPQGSLFTLLHNSRELPWPVRYQFTRDIAAGLTCLHKKNIVHRDLKSHNVLVTDNMHAKLTDFGLSLVKRETSTHSHSSHQAAGTVLWMAPELHEEEAKATRESDMYSYGMTVYEIAARETPFAKAHNPYVAVGWVVQGKRPAIPSDTPKGIANLIGRCWAQRAEERLTAEQALAEAEKLQDALPDMSALSITSTSKPVSSPATSPASGYLAFSFKSNEGKEEKPLDNVRRKSETFDNSSGYKASFSSDSLPSGYKANFSSGGRK